MNITSVFTVGDLLPSMSARGIDKQLSRLPGVKLVATNAVAGTASVTFDPDRVSADAIRDKIAACGFDCAGEVTPAHVRAPRACGDHHHAHRHGQTTQ